MAENTQQNLENQDNNELSEKDLHDIVLKQYELLNNQSHTIRQLQIDKDEMGEEFSITKIFSIFKRDKKKDDNGEKRKGFFSRIFLGIHAVFIWFIKLVLNSLPTIVICTGLGLAFGLVIYFTSDRIYESKIVYSSGVLTNDFYRSNAQVLSDAAKYSPEALAKVLKIDVATAEKVVGIEFDEYEGYESQKVVQVNDTTNAYVMYYPFFSLTFSVTDGTVMDEVEEGTYVFLSNNTYAEKQLNSKLATLKNQMEELEKNKAANDSLNVAVNKKIAGNEKDQYFIKETGMDGKGIILSQETDVDKVLNTITNINNQYVNNKKRIQDQIDRIENNKFETVSHHTSGFKPVFPRVRHIVLYTFYGFLMGTFIALLIMIVKNLKKLVSQENVTKKE
ncbi:MAG: hypothetical protein IKS00_00200 [Bacteroidales bacterium]|nr:hypothetical protein [Bacteroidales bacterium]